MKAGAYSMEEDIPFVSQSSLIRYIQTALATDGIVLEADMILRVLDLEIEYLQHLGIAESEIDDPRPEI
jgi:hypothetical protein